MFPNKQTDNKLYCSQLVWKIHQGAGTNVDSNSLKWFTLMALKLSPYYAWNPPLALAKHAVLIAMETRYRILRSCRSSESARRAEVIE